MSKQQRRRKVNGFVVIKNYNILNVKVYKFKLSYIKTLIQRLVIMIIKNQIKNLQIAQENFNSSDFQDFISIYKQRCEKIPNKN